MQNEVILVTGANGEIGHGLISYLGGQKGNRVIGLDLQPIDANLQSACLDCLQGDILDQHLIEQIVQGYGITTIYHLASILSTKSEYNPELAHRVNVEGTLNLLRLATEQAEKTGRTIKFLYPSSIAVYGLPSLQAKASAGRVKETEWALPITMYGCNKIYCEHIGRYYATHYRQLTGTPSHCIDFRGLRFPGLISAETVPTGGTSDYGPEMLHHAAQGLDYACFVRPDTRLPFMVMPDAIKSMLQLAEAPREKLTQLVYNVTSFNPTAQDFVEIVKSSFPEANITFQPNPARQAIVDSWPEDIDDSAARHDWDWEPEFDQERAFKAYLIPAIQRRYSHAHVG